MSTIEEQLKDVETRILTQTNKIARAEIEREQAQTALANARSLLKEEFAVSTAADITRVRAEMEELLAATVAEIEAELDAAGA